MLSPPAKLNACNGKKQPLRNNFAEQLHFSGVGFSTEKDLEYLS
jgi:hypothetical protein